MRKTLVCLIMTCLLASSLPISSADGTEDIPTVAAGTTVHDSLVAALTHVDLVTTLQGSGPFTVFAPTDQAFTDAGIDLANFQTQEEKRYTNPNLVVPCIRWFSTCKCRNRWHDGRDD